MALHTALAKVIASVASNPFQRTRLAGVGEIQSIEDFTARVPFTTKADIVADFAAHPPYGSNLTFPRTSYTHFCQTSGTTAQPLVILDTAESWDWMLDSWAHIYRAGGIEPGAVVYFAFSFGPFLGFWTAFEGAAKYGCLCIPGGGLSSVARLRAIAENRAEVLCCTPTYALHLAEVAAAERLSLPDCVRKIIVAGEPGGSLPEVRKRISAAWHGAEVLDHYGMTEVGPVAFQRTGEADTLRILEDRYFAESIHPQTLQPVAVGEIGELVLTPFGRTAWPLLRYRTGDLVRSGVDKLEGGILGRADDMLVIRGVNIYPSAVDAVVRSIPEVAEYRVTVALRGEMHELSVAIETTDDTAASRLERAFTAAFTLRIPVTRVPSLPRFELKARRWQRV
jgi:phenylacetate-CoA ligase